jgi:hypothetical protein
LPDLTFSLIPLHPPIIYLYIFFNWFLFLSKEQIDQSNVTGPLMEEDTQPDAR